MVGDPGHQGVDVAAQDLGGVADRLAPLHLQVVDAEEDRLAAELGHARLERDPGPGAGVLEEHAERLAGQVGCASPRLCSRLSRVAVSSTSAISSGVRSVSTRTCRPRSRVLRLKALTRGAVMPPRETTRAETGISFQSIWGVGTLQSAGPLAASTVSFGDGGRGFGTE